MRRATRLAGIAVLAAAGLAVWVRVAPSPVAGWHVDPVTVTTRNPRNSYLLGPGGDGPALRVALPAAETAAAIERVALAAPRTRRLAGDGLWATYVTRSALMGFPDYTSVRVSPDDRGGATVAVFARARFGGSDFGVNRARVERWLAALPR